MKTIIFLMMPLLALNGFLKAQDLPEHHKARDHHEVLYEIPNTVERNYEDSTGSYVVKFTYGMISPYESTGKDEENELRYSAFIEVFRVSNTGRMLVGHGFMGTYAPKGCIFDQCDYLVSEAKKIELKASNR